MRVIIAGGIVLLLTVMVFQASVVVRNALRRRQERRAEWTLDEASEGDRIKLYARRKREEQPLLIGEIDFDSEDFDEQLWELRAEAHEKVYVLNQRKTN